MVDRSMPRPQSVMLPVLREGLGQGVMVTTWMPDLGHRTYPLLNVRREGGGSSAYRSLLDRPIMILEGYSRDGVAGAENLVMDSLFILEDAVAKQTLTDVGYLHSMVDSGGIISLPTDLQDVWVTQAIIRVGIRPLRSKE